MFKLHNLRKCGQKIRKSCELGNLQPIKSIRRCQKFDAVTTLHNYLTLNNVLQNVELLLSEAELWEV